MEFIFNDDYNKRVKREWQNFMNDQPVNKENIRPEILDSWRRCKKAGVNWKQIVPKVIGPEELKRRLVENELMCQVALPFMEKIYNTIKGSESMVTLADKDGVFLKVIQDESLDEFVKSNQNVEGAVQKEEIVGTTEITLCLKTKEAIWCWGEENYSEAGKGWACVAVPIFNEDACLVGIISVSNKVQKAHRHTAGMVTASAKAIENEMQLHRAYNSLKITTNQLAATIETTPQGVIVVDSTGCINNINSHAKRLLCLEKQSIIGQKVGDVLVDKNNSFLHFPLRSMSEQEAVFKVKQREKRFYIETKTFSTEQNHEPNWMLVTLKETEPVRKIAKKLASSYSHYTFDDIIGKSRAIGKAKALAEIAANSTSTLLILGESGTGKELFAQAIHSASTRRDELFVSLNCAALPAGLIESELFGYEGGAFTGARKEGHVGKFELAHNGTIFLDEIGDMPLSVQASVLRTIQTREVTRIGGNQINQINVRIICATHKDLVKGVEEKRIREDFFYRINVLQIRIPPLRERKEDIPLLVDFFLRQYKRRLDKEELTIDESAYTLLKAYHWPGNVRELENVMERIVNFSDSKVITKEDVKQHILIVPHAQSPKSHYDEDNDSSFDLEREPLEAENDSNQTKLQLAEKEIIFNSLKANHGNIAKASEELGIGKRTMYRKCEQYGIDYRMMRR
ncbi:sigma 54-interacting transcriptional regulator [Eubacteriales bacterium DFI.9.88]|nr:sigma 54-interacting transcriptional regulator [Eubacteriales bacterium DFI.9.88]